MAKIGSGINFVFHKACWFSISAFSRCPKQSEECFIWENNFCTRRP